MVVGQNYLRVKKYFLLIFFLFFSSLSYSDDYSLTKITKLDEPWGSTFINNDEIIITEKDGKIKIVNINSKNTFEVKHNLNVLNVGQGGLLDIIYQDNYLWVSYSEDRGNGKTSTSIARASLSKKELNFKNIFQANPSYRLGLSFWI
jgi:quinoprotein glucose dehydrogenase